MTVLLRPRRWATKPPPGVGLNRGDPLARGLAGAWMLQEGGGATLRNLARPSDAATVTGPASWVSSAAGRGLKSGASLAGAALTAPSAALKPATAVTLWWYGTITGAGNLNDNPALAALWYDTGNSSPYVAYGLHRPQGAPGSLACYWNNGSFQSLTVAGAIDTTRYGRPYQFALTIDGAHAQAWQDGRPVGAASASVGTIAYSASAFFTLGRANNATADDAASVTVAAAVWGRALTAAELQRLAADPYALLAPAPARLWAVPSAGGGAQAIDPSGIPSRAALGADTVTSVATVAPSGLASGAAFGTALISENITLTGIASRIALGTPTMGNVIAPAGLASGAAFGAARLDLNVSPSGLASGAALGADRVDLNVGPSGIPSRATLGADTVTPGAASIDPIGLASAEAVGVPNLSGGMIVTVPGSSKLGIHAAIGVG